MDIDIAKILANIDTNSILLVAVLVTIVTFIKLCFKPAPYGKFTPEHGQFFSAKINSKLAWLIQECPAFLIPFHILILKWSILSAISKLGLSLFCIHYFQRSFIYSYLIKSKRPTPIETCVSAFLFCCFNGWIQSKNAMEMNNLTRDSNAFGLGLVLFVTGMIINQSADSHLRELAEKRTGNSYLIPHKGMFKYVSGANYFGEIVEWLGFALVMQTPAAAWFSLFSTLFLGQRGYQTHKYYLRKIEDYPKNRSSVFPFSGF